jgi:hypothetical protein
MPQSGSNFRQKRKHRIDRRQDIRTLRDQSLASTNTPARPSQAPTGIFFSSDVKNIYAEIAN